MLLIEADQQSVQATLAAMLLVVLVAGALVVSVTSRPFTPGDTDLDHL